MRVDKSASATVELKIEGVWFTYSFLTNSETISDTITHQLELDESGKTRSTETVSFEKFNENPLFGPLGLYGRFIETLILQSALKSRDWTQETEVLMRGWDFIVTFAVALPINVQRIRIEPPTCSHICQNWGFNAFLNNVPFQSFLSTLLFGGQVSVMLITVFSIGNCLTCECFLPKPWKLNWTVFSSYETVE